MTKRELLIVGVVLVLIAAAVATWMYEKPANQDAVGEVTQNGQTNASNTPVQGEQEFNVCTQLQVQCADGTFVTPTPPTCEIVCPNVSATPIVANNSGIVEIKIGETGKSSASSGVEITPIGILEDSRCPTDVQCVQAGTVRVRANVRTKSGVSTADFKLGEAVTVGGETVTLTTVLPEKNSKKPVVYADYLFTFKVGK